MSSLEKQKIIKERKREVIYLIFLVSLLLTLNYRLLDRSLYYFVHIDTSLESKLVNISRVIDGDTIETSEGEIIRLLGVNTPEKGELYYTEAKNFLERKLSNKIVKIEFKKYRAKDKYNRTLSYIYINEQNVNLEIIRNGFANYYFPSGRDTYYNEFTRAWMECIKKNLNLCKRSENKCVECIELKKFDYIDEEIVLYNKCDFKCDLTNWSIKDEGRKKFVFGRFFLEGGEEVMIKTGKGLDNKRVLFWKNEDYVWTRTGDTLFLRDDRGSLVLWKRY